MPWLNAAANVRLDPDSRSAVWDERTSLILLSYAALSLTIPVTVIGASRIAARLGSLSDVAALAPRARRRNLFGEANSVIGPLVAAGATAVAFAVDTAVDDGVAPAILRGVTWFVLGVAIWSFLWTYGALQIGLDRLGREHLDRNAETVSPDLGLRPIGDVAFMGLWLLLAWMIPLLWTGVPDLVGFVIGVGVLAGGVAIFFLSLFRLHRRMLEVKQREIDLAARLYAQAYQPVRSEGTLDALDRQHTLLGAAEALEKRARSIQEWPIDDGTLARVATIVTSVVAITIGRLLLDPLGL